VAEAPSEVPSNDEQTGAAQPERELAQPMILKPVIVGCGGWSRRKTLYGGDQFAGREDSPLDPATDAAKIRAFFVHPAWARRGICGLILEACESAAKAKGFHRLEMGATLTGIPFYKAKGYEELEHADAPLGAELSLPIVRMAKKV
jgi:GNAT superfamily N-acetyltransferase